MKIILSALLIFLVSVSMHAQVGIGTTSPNGALDVTSATDGLIIPRVALVNTTTVTVDTPIASELVYNTTPGSGFTDVSPGFYYLSSPTGPWVRLDDGSSGPPPPPPPPVDAGWSLTGNAGIIEGTNFLGTLTDADIAFRRNDDPAGVIGDSNTAFGLFAGENIGAGGSENTAMGVDALQDNVSGDRNTSVGYGALRNTTVGNNTALGFDAAAPNRTGTGNTAIGSQALRFLSEGDNNTAVGYLAGNTATGNNNITIGYQAEVGNGTLNNQVRMGNTAITFASIQVAWSNPSDRRWKETIKDSGLGLDFLKTLRPVSYVRKNDDRKRTEYGFIAQELEQALNATGDKNNAIIAIDDNGMYTVRYNDFISITVKAVQEQQALIEKLQKDNEDLKATNEAILKRLEALENK
jgi:hypothetical protein